MARSISEIRENIAADFMNNPDIAAAYGFTRGSSFSSTFSRASFENVLFGVFAAAAWVIEALFDNHKEEVTTQIEESLPHRPKWYRDKMLDFMVDMPLIQDTDKYDTSGMTDEAIEAAKVVKHAVALESADASILTIKVAGENDGVRAPLDAQTETQLKAYIAEIKDAGVRTALVNKEADIFNCDVDIYYDAILQPETVRANCQTAIVSYIENLPFNGEYTDMALVDTLQLVDGTKVVQLNNSSTSVSGESTQTVINARYVPSAGYFKAGAITINMRVYGTL